jgi:drug/metabolite transporter (DMT)-like permease
VHLSAAAPRQLAPDALRCGSVWSVLSLTLLSAFLHAMWNAGLRREPDKDSAVVVAIAVATTVAAVVAAVRFAGWGVGFATAAAAGWTIAAGVLEAAYFAALARALDTGALGPVYTISRGGALLLVWPASIAWWDEQVTAAQLLGSGVVALGLALCTGARGATRAAVAWSLACAALIAGYHLAYKAALLAGGDGPAVFALSLSVATALNLLRLGAAGRARALAQLRARWRSLALIGVICAAAFLIFLVGLAQGGAGLVLTLRNTSVIFATAFGALLGERPGLRQLLGSTVVAAGAVILGLR